MIRPTIGSRSATRFERMEGYYSAESCELSELKVICDATVDADDVPNAVSIEKNIPVYDAATLNTALSAPVSRRALMAEWANTLHSGAGVFVLKNACADIGAIDAATEIFINVIAQEKEVAGEGSDHFAPAGANDRIWNSLQKLALAAPEIFVRYFASPAIDAACEAWLGPNYQMTAQVNLVHPGGQAQRAHRDYHLGFQTAESSASYPAHVHHLSPLMTLQGAIAHCDIPIESGPTKLLPFSQLYRPGYAAWRREDFRGFFEARHVQLPLAKGDAVFFNPALIHAAGANSTEDVHRMVNLLQVSSAFGRAMESIDRDSICVATYPILLDAAKRNTLSVEQIHAALAAIAEGYSFPTNLDRDPPCAGLAPETPKELLLRCLEGRKSLKIFESELKAQKVKRQA